MISRAAISGVVQGQPKYRSMLAGNAAYVPLISNYYSIATLNGNGSATALTFSGIPSTFTDLEIRATVNSTATSSARGFAFSMYFNGVSTGGQYTLHNIRGYGGGYDNAFSYDTVNTINVPDGATANNPSSSYVAGFKCNIFSYGATDKFKSGYYISGSEMNNTNNDTQINLGGFAWQSTSPITSITVAMDANAFNTGTSFALYGIGGAS
jgi:hypothetical protein